MAQLVIIDKNIELRNSHRTLLESFIKKNTKWSLKQRKLVMKLYDTNITPENIKHYYNRNIKLFLMAMVSGKLLEIKDYYFKA